MMIITSLVILTVVLLRHVINLSHIMLGHVPTVMISLLYQLINEDELLAMKRKLFCSSCQQLSSCYLTC